MSITGYEALANRPPRPETIQKDIPLELFGGLATEMSSADLPLGASPACQDVDFELGSAFTRAGLTALFAGQISGSVNYFKTFTLLNGNQQLLLLDTAGNFYYEDTTNTPGTLNLISSAIIPGSYAKSVTAFGREYIAFSDGQNGTDIPFQWDGTNFDRVSQVGPGLGPATITDISYSISAISRTSGVISVTTSAPHGILPGQLATIGGVFDDATFNGSWPVETVPSPTEFTAWGAPGIYNISTLSRVAGVVTAVLAASPFASSGDSVIISNDSDTSFNGLFTLTSVDGNIVTWAQVLPDAVVEGGTLYTKSTTVPLLSILAVANDQYNATVQLQSGQMNPFVSGAQFTIADNNAPAFNTTWTIAGIGFTSTDVAHLQPVLFTSDPSGSIGAGGYGGTATASVPDSSPTVSGVAGPFGHISGGEHQCVLVFQTRQAYLTQPSPVVKWVAAGGFQAQITGIAIGPANVTKRILAFTSSGGGFFFYVPSPTTGSYTGTQINDNTSQSFVVDFADSTLLSSISIDSAGNNLFALVDLGPCAGVFNYSSRMFWWKELNKLPNLINMSYDGGYLGVFADAIPLGWIKPLVPTNQGGSLVANPAVWGFAYQISSGPAGGTRGILQQGAYQDQNGVPILQPSTQYSMRFRYLTSAIVGPLESVTFHMDIISPSAGTLAQSTFTVNLAFMLEFLMGSATMSAKTPSVIPSDTIIRTYAVFPSALDSGTITLDELQLFPSEQPFNSTNIRASYINNPESFDGVTGNIGIAQNGEAVTTLFQLRDNLYVTKQGSLFSSSDNGTTEPFQWTVNTVSTTVGTPSVNGVANGEEWALLVAVGTAPGKANGLYVFNGNEPMKASQEIQPNWDAINGGFAYLIWAAIDLSGRRLFLGLPTGSSQKPNTVLMMNFREMNASWALAEQGPLHINYSGKIVSWDMSRKWAPWSISANCGAIIERPSGPITAFGNNSNAGKIYLLDNAATSDDGVFIDSQYTTFFFVNRDIEQQMQLGQHRKLYTYLTMFISGTGVLSMLLLADSITSMRTKQLLPRNLMANPSYDMEVPVNWDGDRVAVKLSLGGIVGSFMHLSKMVMSMKQHPYSPLRGLYGA